MIYQKLIKLEDISFLAITDTTCCNKLESNSPGHPQNKTSMIPYQTGLKYCRQIFLRNEQNVYKMTVLL